MLCARSSRSTVPPNGNSTYRTRVNRSSRQSRVPGLHSLRGMKSAGEPKRNIRAWPSSCEGSSTRTCVCESLLSLHRRICISYAYHRTAIEPVETADAPSLDQLTPEEWNRGYGRLMHVWRRWFE